jgi:cell wall assembly regulator SMI1
MNWKSTVENWQSTLKFNSEIGGDSRVLLIEEPASIIEIKSLEESIGIPLPNELKETLLSFSKKVEFSWFLPDDFSLPEPFDEIFCGGCHWSLDWIAQFNKEKDGWVQEVFPNQEDPYDKVWHQTLAFQEVGNGDYLAIDLRNPNSQPVVYLSHDDGEGHGYVLGENFTDFIFRWSKIGCPGAEDWQWLPFTNSPQSYIDPNCENAQQWKKTIKIEV